MTEQLTSRFLQALTASAAAVALTATPVASFAQQAQHPLISNPSASLMYIGQLSEKVSYAAVEAARQRGEPTEGVLHAAGTRTKAAIGELEKALKGQPVGPMAAFSAREGQPGLLVYPKDNSKNMLVIYSVVPPLGNPFNQIPIGVCAQQNDTVVFAGEINPTGQIKERQKLANPAGSNRAACQATLSAMNNDIKAAMAAVVGAAPQPAQPPTVVVGAAGMTGNSLAPRQ